MTPEFPYVQLPGTFRGFFRKASLWEGPDHILCVTGSRFNEEYRRFYYRDIQALIVENRARAGSYGWWAFLIFEVIFFCALWIANTMQYAWFGFAVFSVFLLIRLEISFRRSCRCSVQTAVSREPLPSLRRRSAAKKVIERLELRIAAEQGELPQEIPNLEADVAAAVRPPDPNQPSASARLAAAAVQERKESAIRGVNLAIAALFVLLLNSVFTLWASSAGNSITRTTATVVGYSFIVLGLIPVFLSLQQIGGLRALRGLQVLLVTMIVLSVLRGFMAFVMPFTLASIAASTHNSFSQALLSRYYSNTNGALQLMVAAIGLILIFAKWETYRRGGEESRS